MRWVVPSIVVSLALALLVVGVPRFVSSLLRAPAHAALTEIDAGEVPPRDQLDRAAEHLEKALRWESSAKLSAEIGFLRLLQAFQMDDADPDRATVAARERSIDLSVNKFPHCTRRSTYTHTSGTFSRGQCVVGDIERTVGNLCIQ